MASIEMIHYKDTLIDDITNTFGRLSEVLSAFDEQQLNTVPFPGSWTAGQAAEHIIICTAGIPHTNTTPANRPFDEKVKPVRDLFLDFNAKFEADPSIQPKQSQHDKKEVLEALRKNESVISHIANTTDIEALCLDMELPAFGLLTRYEWLMFILFHTQRHTRQIENIYRSLIQAKGI